MRRLILFRHAKAVGRAPHAGDEQRSLDPPGRGDAVRSGRWMMVQGLAPDVALVSPAARTLETWECVAPFFPRARLEIRDALYEALPEDIAAEIAAFSAEADTVMVVGHNPGLQELAVNLMVDGLAGAGDVEKLAGGFPTSTVAVFAVGGDGLAALEALFNPRRDTPPPFLESWDDEEPGSEGSR